MANMTLHYPIADRNKLPLALRVDHTVMAKWTGEKRPPRKGEWYLSGAIVEAWYAPNDLTTPYHIARLIRVISTVTLHEQEI